MSLGKGLVMKTRVITAVLMFSMLLFLAGCKNADAAVNVTESSAAVSDTTVQDTTVPSETGKDIPVPEGYHLVWSDEFDGSTLNDKIWTRFTELPGWVNNELQTYTESTDNAYVENGNLVIQAVKTADGYTSARLNTQGKQDTKYGRFEIRAKLPKGQGLWPAIWLMPTNESLYGQSPKCGEIDIMEMLGNDTSTMYSTIHYGDPHTSQSTTYKLDKGSFADDYHVFAVEWEPSEIRFYVDGVLYYTVNDWFTKVEGMDEVTFPAPFDQPFYVILNLAVGGDWPGSPDATTDFANAKMLVDYVRVFQLENYDENVSKPEKAAPREADATGNLIVNGDFSTDESLTDTDNWYFLTFLNGTGTAAINDGKLVVETTNAGTEECSVQIVQRGLPMEDGGEYRLTFDAYASEDRTMIAAVTAPDLSWIRYLKDTKLNLTTEPQTFTLDFAVTTATDTNGRMEFNLGFQDSKATVYIDNVRLVKTAQKDVGEKVKSVLPDGNFIYNGGFDSGVNRLGYWTVSGAAYSVTNMDNIRELMLTVGNETATVSQDKLTLSKSGSYVLSFDARSDGNASATASIGGKEFAFDTSNNTSSYSFPFTVDEESSNYILNFLFDKANTFYLDNVKIVEVT